MDVGGEKEGFLGHIKGGFKLQNVQGLLQSQVASVRVSVDYGGCLKKDGSLQFSMGPYEMLVEVTLLQVDG